MIVRFHALLSVAGIDEEGKLDMLSGYGVESSKDLTADQLEEICDFVRGIVRAKEQKKDKLRKRALRAVCQLCEVMNEEWGGWDEKRRIGYAKAILCRAAKVENFNKIGEDRLRSLANSFAKQRKDMDGVVAAVRDMLGGGINGITD